MKTALTSTTAGPSHDPRRLLWCALLLFWVGLVPACTSSMTLKPADRARVMAGDKALVLLRLDCRVDGRPYEPFSFTVLMDNLSFGTGSFDTVGEPVLTLNGFLSDDSRREGWTFLLLPAGTHYLTVRPPQRSDAITYDRMLKSGPRWRIDVPAGARLVYVGTLSLSGEGDFLFFGGPILRAIDEQHLAVRNEQARAARLLAQSFPEAGPMTTRLMQRWHKGDPLIIRSSPPGP